MTVHSVFSSRIHTDPWWRPVWFIHWLWCNNCAGIRRSPRPPPRLHSDARPVSGADLHAWWRRRPSGHTSPLSHLSSVFPWLTAPHQNELYIKTLVMNQNLDKWKWARAHVNQMLKNRTTYWNVSCNPSACEKCHKTACEECYATLRSVLARKTTRDKHLDSHALYYMFIIVLLQLSFDWCAFESC